MNSHVKFYAVALNPFSNQVLVTISSPEPPLVDLTSGGDIMTDVVRTFKDMGILKPNIFIKHQSGTNNLLFVATVLHSYEDQAIFKWRDQKDVTISDKPLGNLLR